MTMAIPLPASASAPRPVALRARPAALAPVPQVTLPRPGTPAQSAAPAAVSLPRQSQPNLAPVPQVALPGLGAGKAVGPPGLPSMNLPGANSAELGRITGLLERIADGVGKRDAFAEKPAAAADGPVQETGWRTLFNGMPLDSDDGGNLVLRRRQ
jgi:hypothetical protein